MTENPDNNALYNTFSYSICLFPHVDVILSQNTWNHAFSSLLSEIKVSLHVELINTHNGIKSETQQNQTMATHCNVKGACSNFSE